MENIGLYILVILCLLGIAGTFYIVGNNQPETPQAVDEQAIIASVTDNILAALSPAEEEVVVPVEPSADDKIDEILSTLNEEDEFDSVCIDLANDEWSEKDYKAIYEAIDDLFGNIDEREDIDSVVIKDSDVDNADVDDEECDVEQEIKVYYENLNGKDVKVYLTIDSEIRDGELEDQVISQTI